MINNNELPNRLSFDNDFTKERYRSLLQTPRRTTVLSVIVTHHGVSDLFFGVMIATSRLIGHMFLLELSTKKKFLGTYFFQSS